MESQVNDYQLKQGNLLYVFSTSIVNNLVRLSCKNSYGKKYSRDFSVYEINSIDPMFSEISSEQDAINFIDKALNVHKVGVREETGEVKIIFYVKSKGGLLNSVEIPLGEDGKPVYSSYDATQQTYENANYLYGGENTYDQNIGISTTDYSGQNFENLGSYNFQDNNQYTQNNYENYGTTSFDNYGMNTFGNDYNASSYQYSYNQYSTTTDNNYISSDYDNAYQINGESTFDLNSLTNTNNYEDVTNTGFYSKPVITPADPIETPDNENKDKSQFETHTTPVYNSNTEANDQKENQTETLNKNNSAKNLTTSQKEPDKVNISLNASEIQRLKNEAAEAQALRAQLAPLRQQFEQMSVLKGQLD